MTHKKLAFKVNKKDIKFLSQQLIMRAIDRFNENNKELYTDLDKGFGNEDLNEIFNALSNIVKNCNSYCQELDNVVPVIKQVDELLPANTEILEDLPDLEKDSL